jgi:hypothetical protein
MTIQVAGTAIGKKKPVHISLFVYQQKGLSQHLTLTQAGGIALFTFSPLSIH